MASSVAAIGIGIGMMGAAAASLMAAVSQMVWWQLLVGVAAVVYIYDFVNEFVESAAEKDCALDKY